MLAIGVRVTAFLLAWTLFTTVTNALAMPSDANIGLGLLSFAVLAVAAAVWAALDGRHGTPLDRLLVRWAVVTVALGVYVPVFTWLREPGRVLGALASDLIVVSPLIAGVTFGPAAIAGAAGSMTAANRRSRRR